MFRFFSNVIQCSFNFSHFETNVRKYAPVRPSMCVGHVPAMFICLVFFFCLSKRKENTHSYIFVHGVMS